MIDGTYDGGIEGDDGPHPGVAEFFAHLTDDGALVVALADTTRPTRTGALLAVGGGAFIAMHETAMKLWIDDWDAGMGITGTTLVGQTSPSGGLKHPIHLANAPDADLFVAHAFTDSFEAASSGTATAGLATDTFLARLTP